MSDLKYKTLPELLAAKRYETSKLAYHSSKASGCATRLEWIDKYISEKELENEKAKNQAQS